MEQLQRCVLVFCAACIVSGLLERISCARRRFPVIKLVCTLYIVSAVFVPMQDRKAWDPDSWIPEPPGAVSAPDTRQLALEAAEASLSEAVAEALAAADIECRAVRVHLGRQDETAAVTGVSVTAPTGTDEERAARVIAQALGVNAPLDVQWEGS